MLGPRIGVGAHDGADRRPDLSLTRLSRSAPDSQFRKIQPSASSFERAMTPERILRFDSYVLDEYRKMLHRPS
jgi:hypothetical protein